ncbi:helix-turn-helix domain-containing protein [Halomonas urumqiensis]|uniref:Insertion element IS150 protein InsJ-like helix-turn-helix domain-containing protein n=1 Tax=Halomonas urumqiensis TaxID=1684789 RepID=A0A2N7UCK8_9GAMM|nr:helix-turn-helix domain-containing protein [Halomonas urumqiensis]PMR78150.1 hypothetical protein C1H70_15355 [Halomonas urumqiensis]PTB03299.1 helix-turn-helix domain-containing protein [Halomonas urumqiensis]GHE20538.1 hypothetical protein GCM10017767_10590 [Halomonas urumqiensis]
MATKHLSPEVLNERRKQAVRLRLDGHTVKDACERTGLSAPTVSAAWKAFREGGWKAVPVRQRGRAKGQANVLDARLREALGQQLLCLPPAPLPGWTSRALADWLNGEQLNAEWLNEKPDAAVTPRAIEHWWEGAGLKVNPLALDALEKRRNTAGRWYRQQVLPVRESVEREGGAFWQGGVCMVKPCAESPGRVAVYWHGKRGALHLRTFESPPKANDYIAMFERLLDKAHGPVAVVFHGAAFDKSPEIGEWLERHPSMRLIAVPATQAGS